MRFRSPFRQRRAKTAERLPGTGAGLRVQLSCADVDALTWTESMAELRPAHKDFNLEPDIRVARIKHEQMFI
jgi:hypothetical protein